MGLALTAQQMAQLLDFLALLQKWNKVYNLTAVRDPQEMLTHHLLDSLAAVPHCAAISRRPGWPRRPCTCSTWARAAACPAWCSPSVALVWT